MNEDVRITIYDNARTAAMQEYLELRPQYEAMQRRMINLSAVVRWLSNLLDKPIPSEVQLPLLLPKEVRRK